jgi:hypothetical protein
MASTYTTSLRLEKQGNGENPNTWGQKLNQSVIELIDSSVAGYTSITVSSTDVTLTTSDGGVDQARTKILEITGTLTANVAIIIPQVPKDYVVYNKTTGAYTVTFKTVAAAGVVIVQNGIGTIICDGSAGNVYASNGTGIGAGNLFSVSASDIGLNLITQATTATTRNQIGMDSPYVSTTALIDNAVISTKITTTGSTAIGNAIGQRLVSTAGPISATDPGSLGTLYTGDLWYKTTAFS